MKEPDLVFEAICKVCRLDWHDMTPSERGRVNRAAKELREKDPAEILRRGQVAQERIRPPAYVTPQTLCSMWTQLGTTTEAEEPAEVPAYRRRRMVVDDA